MRPDVSVGDTRRDGVGERERELVQEVRVGSGEAEADRTPTLAGDDAAREVAGLWRLRTLGRTDDTSVIAGRLGTEPEHALDRSAEILGAHDPPGRVANPRP